MASSEAPAAKGGRMDDAGESGDFSDSSQEGKYAYAREKVLLLLLRAAGKCCNYVKFIVPRHFFGVQSKWNQTSCTMKARTTRTRRGSRSNTVRLCLDRCSMCVGYMVRAVLQAPSVGSIEQLDDCTRSIQVDEEPRST